MIHMHKSIIITLDISKVLLISNNGSKTLIIIIVIIIYRRHSIIKQNFLLKAWGTKKIIFIKPASPSLQFSIALATMAFKEIILITLLLA